MRIYIFNREKVFTNADKVYQSPKQQGVLDTPYRMITKINQKAKWQKTIGSTAGNGDSPKISYMAFNRVF